MDGRRVTGLSVLRRTDGIEDLTVSIPVRSDLTVSIVWKEKVTVLGVN